MKYENEIPTVFGHLFPGGSEWRKWDLHVHTPYSVLNNGFKVEFEAYARDFFTKAVEKEIAVVGVTDYFCIEGYKRLCALQQSPAELDRLLGPEISASARKVLLLPNVELRLSPIVHADRARSKVPGQSGEPAQREKRVNYHLIFSSEVRPDDIEEFLGGIAFTSESYPGDQDDTTYLTVVGLTRLGERLLSSCEDFRGRGLSPLQVGMTVAAVDPKVVKDALNRKKGVFGGKYMIICANDKDFTDIPWHGSGHLVRKTIIQGSDMFFSSNENDRKWALGKLYSDVEDYVGEFKRLRPCIWGSDAHDLDKMFEPDRQRYCWIKADPTFRGLRQLLVEPENRVYIGAEPPALREMALRRDRTLESISILPKSVDSKEMSWFDDVIPLTPELCAVIGNKGSGKSALADFIALVGNSNVDGAEYSFLKKKRFLELKPASKSTRVRCKWRDARQSADFIDLLPQPKTVGAEQVKYIPQDFLERICSSESKEDAERFHTEFERCIYSHIPMADRLEFRTFAELRAHHLADSERRIAVSRQKIKRTGAELLEVMAALDPDHQTELQTLVEAKCRELDSLLMAEPKAPVVDEGGPSVETAELANARTHIEELRAHLLDAQRNQARLTKDIDAARSTIRELTELQALFDDQLRKLEGTFDRISSKARGDLRLRTLVALSLNVQPVEELLKRLLREKMSVDELLSSENQAGLPASISAAAERMTAVMERLDRPAKLLAEHQERHRVWKEQISTLNGGEEDSASLLGIRRRIKDLESLPARKSELLKERMELALSVWREIAAQRDQLNSLYRGVIEFAKQMDAEIPAASKVGFEARVSEAGFTYKMSAMINHGKIAGKLRGVESGRATLQDAVNDVQWEHEDSVREFLERILMDLELNEDRFRKDSTLLTKGYVVQDMFDYLFCLEYLSCDHALKWEGGHIEQLSPGQRGTLLLVFYLLLDQDTKPLVIDQPEANLDNETVFTVLVPCVKQAKKRRQIILVTHNPNLAVVCDAEQIVYSQMIRDGSTRIKYESGSIESPQMSKRVVDVLEGTMPAFDNRKEKYAIATQTAS